MKKEFEVILFLSILVLSLSFSSAGWFSDAWNTITGKVISGDGSGLSAYYSMNGNFKDNSGNGKDGVLYGAANCNSTGVDGTACAFDGTSGFVAIPTSVDFHLNNTLSRTFSLWFNYASVQKGTMGVLFSKWNDNGVREYRVYMTKINETYANFDFTCNYNNPIIQVTTPYVADTWANAVFISNKTHILFYLNGVLIKTGTNLCVTEGANSLLLGMQSTQVNTDRKFTGKVDEFKIYNRALTDVEVKELYSLGSANTTISPVVTQNCTDSDGGLNYWAKGVTIGKTEDGRIITSTDSCGLEINGVFEPSHLNEFSCNGSISVGSGYDCPNGCSDGACLNVTTYPKICNDSDNGINYYAKGTVAFNYLGQRPDPILFEDWCGILDSEGSGSSHGVSNCSGSLCIASDYFCGDDKNLNTNHQVCPNGCVNGACVNATISVEPNASCSENYKIRASDFRSSTELGADSIALQILRNGAWETISQDRQVDDIVTIGNLEIKPVAINRSARFVYFAVASPAVVDYKSIDEPSLSYAVINSNFVGFNGNEDNYFVVSYCGNTTVPTCQAEVNLIKNPSNVVIDGRTYSLNYNNSYVDKYSGETYSYASWSGGDNNGYNYIWANVAELKDSSVAQQRLNGALESGICQVSRVYINYSNEEYQNVYTCKNIWRIAQQNQQVSTGNAWNYQNDVVVLWFNNNLFFSFEFSSNDYNTCYDTESCQRIEEENHRRQQSDLIEAMDKIINNRNEPISAGYLNYQSEQFVKQFLWNCNSQVKDVGYEGSWSCRIDPAICPPHGEQKQTCTRWNQITKKDEVRETTAQCNPGVCSGCMIPKWFGSAWESKCIEYGFRFAHTFGSYDQMVENNESRDISLNEFNDELEGMVTLDILSDSQAMFKVNRNLISTKYPDFEFSLDRLPDSISKGIESYSALTGDEVKVTIKEFAGAKENSLKLKLLGIAHNEGNVNSSVISIVIGNTYLQNTPLIMNAYCDIDGNIKEQKVKVGSEWPRCQNNYECFSNMCSNGECVDTAAIASELKGFKGFIIRMLCRLSNPFSEAGYGQCLMDNQ